MPTRKERETIGKLMLMVANAFDENRKEIEYDKTKPHPEYTLDELRPLANEAMSETQKMFETWGK